MHRMYRWSSRVLLALIVMFVLGIAISAGFGEGTFVYAIGTVFGVFGACMSPFIALIALITGIGTLVEGRAGTSSKRKNDYLADLNTNPDRLQRILRQLSPEDRDYLQQQLAVRKLGVSGDGELMSLDELMAHDSEDDEPRSLYTG
jgi:hypothetical protein